MGLLLNPLPQSHRKLKYAPGTFYYVFLLDPFTVHTSHLQTDENEHCFMASVKITQHLVNLIKCILSKLLSQMGTEPIQHVHPFYCRKYLKTITALLCFCVGDVCPLPTPGFSFTPNPNFHYVQVKLTFRDGYSRLYYKI